MIACLSIELMMKTITTTMGMTVIPSSVRRRTKRNLQRPTRTGMRKRHRKCTDVETGKDRQNSTVKPTVKRKVKRNRKCFSESCYDIVPHPNIPLQNILPENSTGVAPAPNIPLQKNAHTRKDGMQEKGKKQEEEQKRDSNNETQEDMRKLLHMTVGQFLLEI